MTAGSTGLSQSFVLCIFVGDSRHDGEDLLRAVGGQQDRLEPEGRGGGAGGEGLQDSGEIQ